MFEYDDLSIYRGSDIKIKDGIVVKQPTLDQIERFGEKRYFNSIYTLTSVGADLKAQLWEIDIDYTTIDDYDLFINYISKVLSSQKKIYNELMSDTNKYKAETEKLTGSDLEFMERNPLELILGDIDLADFIPMNMKYPSGAEEVVLFDPDKEIMIDRICYLQIVEVVRKIHGFKRNNEIPGNNSTKIALIEDAQAELEAAKNKQYTSILKPLISALKIECGLCGSPNLWNMHIGEFFYDIKRMNKMTDTKLLLQGAYSGFASLKGISKSRLDMFSEI